EFPYIEDSRASAGFLTATLGNPDLRWETTTQVNLGIEFALALNRVMGSVDLYDSRTKDLLLNRAISPVHGISGVLTNMGRTRNRGVELSLSTTNIEGNDFGWTSDFNIAANRNAILDLYGNGEDDIGNRWFIGHPVDVNYGYQFDGIFQTDDNIAGSAQPTAK